MVSIEYSGFFGLQTQRLFYGSLTECLAKVLFGYSADVENKKNSPPDFFITTYIRSKITLEDNSIIEEFIYSGELRVICEKGESFFPEEDEDDIEGVFLYTELLTGSKYQEYLDSIGKSKIKSVKIIATVTYMGETQEFIVTKNNNIFKYL